MQTAGYRIFWSYRIDPGQRDAFLAAYRDDGTWARLFARHPGFIATQLFRAEDEPDTWLTVDLWRSRADFEDFRRRFAADYARHDAECAALTLTETPLGASNGEHP